MKIFVGSLQQEANSFSISPCTMEDFDFIEGKDMLNKIACTSVFLDAQAEIAVSYYANAVPSGVISEELFVMFRDKMVNALKEAGSVDGVWLYLHGSMDIGKEGSGELALLKALREVTGFDIPYALALDFHASNSPEIVKYANIICGYRTAPHCDMAETQMKAAKLLVEAIEQKILPKAAMVTIPVILVGDMVLTANPPMCDVLKRLDEIEERDDEVMSISFFGGHNWIDSHNNHNSVVVIARHNPEKCLPYAYEIAKMHWDNRHAYDFTENVLEASRALQRAANENTLPVFVSDSGDNTTAGAPGNSTYLLREAIRLGMSDIIFGGIFDRAAYQKCKEAGVSGKVSLELGTCDAYSKEPLSVDAEVLSFHEALGWDGESAGAAVLVRIGTIDAIITERRTAFTSPQIFESCGVNLEQYHTYVVKLGYLYPKLAEAAGISIIATTPGVSCIDVKKLPFTNIEHPMFPFDHIEEPEFKEYY